MQAVFCHQIRQVAVVENFYIHVGVELLETAQLAIFLCDQMLAHGRELDVEVEIGQVKVGRKRFFHVAVRVPFEGKGARFIFPTDAIKIQNVREFDLSRMLGSVIGIRTADGGFAFRPHTC